MSNVRAGKRKETPFKCGRLAESLMGKLTADVLEFFGSPVHYEVFDPESDTYVISERLYPAFAVGFMRDRLLHLSAKLIESLAMANSVNPSTSSGIIRDREIAERRIRQDLAIEYIAAMQAQCRYIAAVFPMQMHHFKAYAEELKALDGAARAWKRYIPPEKKQA